MFRGKFVAQLRAAYERGELRLQGSLEALCDPAAFAACLDLVMAKPWVVYAKRPFGGPLQVLKYLARYTHRVAIGNRRILDVSENGVRFRWRDSANGNRSRTMVLPGVDFLRRFLLHVLPRGFARIRHYGLLGNRKRAVKLATCRLLLGAPMPTLASAKMEPATPHPERCPSCKVGHLVKQPFTALTTPEIRDSS